MKEYVDCIEKFLRGEMSQQEERVFRKEVSYNRLLLSVAISITGFLRAFRR